MMNCGRRCRWLVWMFALFCAMPAWASGIPARVVLIGGRGSEGVGKHDYANGVRLLAGFLEKLPAENLRVAAYPNGWPDDAHAFDAVSSLVLYCDGDAQHPLRDPMHRRQFEALMRRGVGLVVLHQAVTVPAAEPDLGLQRWLGATRIGLRDRTTETTTLQPATPLHPVLRGVEAFSYRDEFYPTLQFAGHARVIPLLTAVLHPQFRDGHAVLADDAETHVVAWAYERRDVGRAFGYSGGHFLVALDQPMLRRLLLNAILWTAHSDVPAAGAFAGSADAAASTVAREETRAPVRSQRVAGPDHPTFHHDARRSGWNSVETALTPATVASPQFGLLWESPELDVVDGEPPRLYASPLYIDSLTVTAGEHRGETLAAAIAASSNGFVYAINTEKNGDVAAGRILWRTRLAQPCHLKPAPLDAVPTGVLATPVADLAHGRLYVTSCDRERSWQAFALDLGNGEVVAGWPVRLDEPRLNEVNHNAGPHLVPPARRFDFRVQRGALNLSPDGSRLYVTFGETETGWLASIDTHSARVDSAFAAVAMPHRGSGGIWGSGGPAVDTDGAIYVATGSGFDGYKDQPHDWTQSLLKLSDMPLSGLRLEGTYTPFNHCLTAKSDIDLGSGGVVLLPDLPSGASSTPRLLAIGGKQGNAYLLDREHLPGKFDRRPRCGTDAANDGSLLPPAKQPQFGTRGPLNVFGPYSEADGAMNIARARSVPAVFRAADGALQIFMTGNTREKEGSAKGIPPSLVRLRVETSARKPAWLGVDRQQRDVVFGNPGSPVVSSNGNRNALVWVLDENAPRSALLSGSDVPAPVLYAFDAQTLDVVWKSAPGQLATSGKYNEPVIARGLVLVGTDRIQAFGLGERHIEHVRQTIAAAPREAAKTTSGLDGATIYRQHCAMCHDHAQGNIPPRAWIATRPKAEIIDALVKGVMRAQAANLSAADIDAVAAELKK